jgi:hypothetical protein
VASAKIGEAGPFEGTPVLYRWPWYWHLPTLGPWLLLVMAIALPKTNRHPHALLILVPMLVLGLLWRSVMKLTGMSSATDVQFSFLIEFLAVGIALLWLNADKLGRHRRVLWFGMSFGILLLADLVAVLSYWGTFQAAETSVILVFTAIIAVILLISLALARWLSHRRYKPLGFMLSLAAWSTVCSLAGAAAFVAVMRLVAAYPIRDLYVVLAQIVVPGLAISLCLYAVNLPYMLLMFSCSFFRRRFQIWLDGGPALSNGQDASAVPEP